MKQSYLSDISGHIHLMMEIASVNDYGGNGHIDKNGKWIDYEEYKQDNNTYHNYDAERWDALTDGMEGDYPGSGVDYDLLGF